MTKNSGRHELKHYINFCDFLQLSDKLPCVMRPDSNTKNGEGYRVRSLYFDNYADKALREKLDGINEREKFRLRLYNDDTSFIRLEKKSKKNGICFKESAVITAEECQELLNGNYQILKDSGKPLLTELYAKMTYQSLRPKNIVDYKRSAYVFKAGNVRITLDYDLRTNNNPQSFLEKSLITVPIPDAIVLEVKYDAFLPEFVKGVIGLASRQRSSFSKYAITRMV